MVIAHHHRSNVANTVNIKPRDWAAIPARRAGRLGQSGALATECVMALGMIAIATIPLLFAFMQEATYSRSCYYRAAAMEIVDGEMEILAAGEWKQFAVGQHDYPVTASSATNLPPGQFRLSVEPKRLRLEWRPIGGKTNNAIARERALP